MARETWVQSQVESYQRLKKWYLMPPCLTLSIIRYGSRVRVEQSREGVAPSPTYWCSSYRKGSLQVTLDYGRQLILHILLLKCPHIQIAFWNSPVLVGCIIIADVAVHFPEILRIGLSSHKMYSNNILNFEESRVILNAWTKNSGNLLNAPHIL